MQAALGYVSERAEGFVDFDAVPEEGASVGELLAFVLSPEARELRPLLVGWLSGAADLVLRDRWAPRCPLEQNWVLRCIHDDAGCCRVCVLGLHSSGLCPACAS